MESYRYVKREGMSDISVTMFYLTMRYCLECLRKHLHRWLSATRTVRRRRITLKEKEDEMNTRFLMEAWDKWRERFVEERMRTTVSEDVQLYVVCATTHKPKEAQCVPPTSPKFTVPNIRRVAFENQG